MSDAQTKHDGSGRETGSQRLGAAPDDAGLEGVLEELRALEPIFHTTQFGLTAAAAAMRMVEDYWEVGASGRRYSRDFILETLRSQALSAAEDEGWQAWNHAVRRVGPETYLLTYVLQQGDRRTRRASLWRREAEEMVRKENTSDTWQVLYHQGTVVLEEEP